MVFSIGKKFTILFCKGCAEHTSNSQRFVRQLGGIYDGGQFKVFNSYRKKPIDQEFFQEPIWLKVWDLSFTSLNIQLIELENICKKNEKLEYPIDVKKIMIVTWRKMKLQ